MRYLLFAILLIAGTAQAQTLVYSCPEAADGRVLESAAVSWPNCVGADYKAPSRSLVVAVNTGTPPLVWTLASKLTTEKVWTQTGTTGAWVAADGLIWAATPAPPVVAGSTAELTWTTPTQNTDGSVLTNLTGYEIYSSAISASDLGLMITLPDPGLRAYSVANLSPGTYYFGIKAVAATGTSDMSNVVKTVKTAPVPPPLPVPTLKTVGGDAFLAGPNYTDFEFKTGEKLGTIVAGVKCDATRRVKATDFYRVPNASIAWSGTKRTDYMAAACRLQ